LISADWHVPKKNGTPRLRVDERRPYAETLLTRLATAGRVLSCGMVRFGYIRFDFHQAPDAAYRSSPIDPPITGQDSHDTNLLESIAVSFRRVVLYDLEDFV
jgi:hypothetical protein